MNHNWTSTGCKTATLRADTLSPGAGGWTEVRVGSGPTGNGLSHIWTTACDLRARKGPAKL